MTERMRALRLDAIIALLLLGGACANSSEPSQPAPRTIELRGELAATRSVSLAAPFDGTIRKVHVREGEAVHAGDVLIELTNAEVERNLAVARTQREYAERKLAASHETPRASASDDDGGALAEAEAMVARRKAKRDRYLELYKTHDVTLQETEAAEDEYAAAVRELANLRRSRTSPAAVSDNNPRIAEIELEKARADEQLAESRQQSLVIKAPIDGVITKLDAVDGRDVAGRDAVAEVTAMSNLEARADVDPDLLRVIHAGMPVEVKLLTIPPKVVLDKIAYVVPFRGAQPQGERRSVVIVNITNPDGALQPGTPALLTIRTQS